MNIVLIGNGFDLSHNLKTDYTSFVNHLIEQSLINKNSNEDLFIASHSSIGHQMIIKHNGQNLYINSKNLFFRKILNDIQKKKWSDIETLYFEELKKTENIYKLNKDFEIVKTKLELYLSKFNPPKTNELYQSIFEFFGTTGTTFINFNYTNFLHKSYLQKIYSNNGQKINLINIHGELNNPENPIIFGYSADEDEIQELLNRGEPDFSHNIKSYNYKRNSVEKQIDKLLDLDNYNYFNVYIIGQSCSVSDKNILNKILNHQQLNKINIMYYDNFEGYRDTLINIRRIVGSGGNYSKVEDFRDSLKTPQYDFDQNDKNEFNKIINSHKSEYPEMTKKMFTF